jgi:hypothetical protein
VIIARKKSGLSTFPLWTFSVAPLLLDPSVMARILGLPAGIVLVGYLCMEYVARFTDAPNARDSRWRKPAVI